MTPPEPYPTLLHDLPDDLIITVLARLAPRNGIFCTMQCSRKFCIQSRKAYATRQIHVKVGEELQHAIEFACPGDTLRLQSGTHTISVNLCIENPLRIIGSDSSQLHISRGKIIRTKTSVIFKDITIVQLSAVAYNHAIFVDCGLLTMLNCDLFRDSDLPDEQMRGTSVILVKDGNLELPNTEIWSQGFAVCIRRGRPLSLFPPVRGFKL